MKTTLATLILPTSSRCLCGVFLANKQERADGLCTSCADMPAVSDVRPDVISAYAMATVHGEGIGQTLDAMTATVNAWNTCIDKTAFLNQ